MKIFELLSIKEPADLKSLKEILSAPKKVKTAICANCEEVFPIRLRRVKFCSNACNQQYQARIRNARLKEKRRKKKEAMGC